MYRIAIEKLLKWKQSKRRKPLIIEGARQVGKTWLMKEFGRQSYADTVYINFDSNSRMAELFASDLDTDRLIMGLELYVGHKIDPNNSLLIFDEVQECPNIVSSLKYFCQDFRQIPVIATGSMVRIKIQRETHKRGSGNDGKFLFPVGKINQITIYPMTFDEFLMNSNSMLYDTIKKAYENKTPLDMSIHELAMEQVYKYLLVGGMPEAVEAYIDGENLFEAVLGRIL